MQCIKCFYIFDESSQCYALKNGKFLNIKEEHLDAHNINVDQKMCEQILAVLENIWQYLDHKQHMLEMLYS